MERQFYVYILASQRNGTLYIGVTNDLSRRVYEHKCGIGGDFTRRYKVKILVHYEVFDMAYYAIAREKALKKWNRSWKIDLIEKNNPQWMDLYMTLNC